MAYGDLTGQRAGRGYTDLPPRRRRTFYARQPKAFVAGWPGRCVACSNRILAGQMIRGMNDSLSRRDGTTPSIRRYQHVSCTYPDYHQP